MTRMLLPVLVALLVLGSLTAALSQHPWSPRRDVVQPVPFSHRVHAGENQIPCQCGQVMECRDLPKVPLC